MNEKAQSVPRETRMEQISRLKRLTEVELPALAVAGRWPIRFDHCFKRICFDFAFEDVWYKHLARPAERHLDGVPLLRALQCAEELTVQGLSLLKERNRASLGYRGKQARRQDAI